MRTRVRRRPAMHTSYAAQAALFDSPVTRAAAGLLLVVAAAAPLLLTDESLHLLAVGGVTALGAIGLGLVTGHAGQVSLGHAFFLAVGAYTAAVLSGDPQGRTLGYGITEVLIWLPAAGLAAALFGALVAPLAVRLRGLYLAVVTLALVFVGERVFTEWRAISGGAGTGRPGPAATLFGHRLDAAGVGLTRDQQLYWLVLVVLAAFTLAAANLARSRVGRAFAAIRDRDVAAASMGVDLTRYKTVAFAVSSFYGGCAGALLFLLIGYVTPESFTLGMSVLYIAMVLVGGAGSVSGAILGAFFFTLLTPLTRALPGFLPVISTAPGETPNVFQLETVLYGALIIVFLIFEPRGLIGIWRRARAYWTSWPFSY